MNNKELLIGFIKYAKSKGQMRVLDLKVEQLVDDYLSSQNNGKPFVIRRLFDIKYHSSYGVPFVNTASYMACDEADALTQFWDGKNKESYEVTLVLPRINGV